MSKNILVTGGAGYIGSQTCKTLHQWGFRPIVYDNLSRGHGSTVKWGPLIKGDLSETEKISRALVENKVEAVVHFAAYAYVGESVQKPELYYENNVHGTLSLLQAMQKSGVNKIVFSSTCATYGTPRTDSITEDHLQNPINPYGQTKLMVEKILQDCAPAWGLKSCALRYFNAAGADIDGDLGEMHDPETHLIPLVIMAALEKAPPISIFGDNYPTKDGTCIRDYIHVQDLATAHVQSLNYLFAADEPTFSAFNLGTGQGHSVREVIQGVEQIIGKKVPQLMGSPRTGDPAKLVADAGKAQKILKWKPQYSDLHQILRTAFQWIQSQARP